MKIVRRCLLALCTTALGAGLTALSPSVAAADTSPTVTVPRVTSSAVAPSAATGLPCGHVRVIGHKKVVRDKGMNAFTVRQLIGYCTDGRGSAWMNLAAVYVWKQYHAKGYDYRAQVGVAVEGDQEPHGYVVGPNRQRLTYSTPVRTVEVCTQGWGKLLRDGIESGQGLTSLVC